MLKGHGGSLELNLGGSNYVLVGEVEKWTLELNRSAIPNTTLDLESETFIKGKKSHTGTVNYLIRLYTNANRLSAAQLIPLILDNETSGISVLARFYLGTHSPDETWRNDIPTVITFNPYFAGELILEQTALETPANDLITCRSSFRVNGEMTFTTAPPPPP